MEQSKKNFPRYCIQVAAYAVASMFCTGAIVQAFLLLIGLSESEVYIYSSLTQLAQVAVMVLMIFIVGRMKRARLVSAISNLLLLIPMAIFIIGAKLPSVMSDTYVMIIFLACIVAYGGVGMYAVLSYTLPYKLIDIADYGKLTGISGAASGVITFAVSSLHTLLVTKLDYISTTVWFYVFAMLSALLSMLMFLSMKEIPSQNDRNESVSWSDMLAVFKNKDTYYLLIPNVSRGLAFGVFNVMAVIAVGAGVAETKDASALNLIIQLASFSASLVFSLFYKKLTVERMLLFATLGICVVLPLSLSFGFIPFLILMLIALFFRFIVDSAIPTSLVKIIPESQIGAYSSIRMLVFTASQALAAILVLPLVSVIGYNGVLIFAVIMQLVCGIGHYAVVINHRKK